MEISDAAASPFEQTGTPAPKLEQPAAPSVTSVEGSFAVLTEKSPRSRGLGLHTCARTLRFCLRWPSERHEPRLKLQRQWRRSPERIVLDLQRWLQYLLLQERRDRQHAARLY